MSILLSRQFRYFIKVMETRCLNKAAEELCITRSPLGKIITEIERRIGEKLFIRKYNELIPTEAALSLYDKINPAYNILKSMDDELDRKQTLSSTDIIFDLSIPTVLCNYFTDKLRLQNFTINSRRVDVTTEDLSTLLLRRDVIIVSYRQHSVFSGVQKVVMPEEQVFMHMPDNVDREMLLDPAKMKEIPLLINKESTSNAQFIGTIIHALKDNYPHLQVKITDEEITLRLYQVAAGNAMVLLPERLSGVFSLPKVKKNVIPDLKVKLTAFYHSRPSNKDVLDAFLNDLRG